MRLSNFTLLLWASLGLLCSGIGCSNSSTYEPLWNPPQQTDPEEPEEPDDVSFVVYNHLADSPDVNVSTVWEAVSYTHLCAGGRGSGQISRSGLLQQRVPARFQAAESCLGRVHRRQPRGTVLSERRVLQHEIHRLDGRIGQAAVAYTHL